MRAPLSVLLGLLPGLLLGVCAEPLSREALITAQRQLAALGYTMGDPEGEIGDDTRSALTLFRQDYDLPTRRWLNAELVAVINHRYSLMLQRRDEPAALPPELPLAAAAQSLGKYCVVNSGALQLASSVRQLQLQLAELGYRPGNIAGRQGPQYQQALAAFQGDYDIAASGRADEPTRLALLAAVTAMRRNRQAAERRRAGQLP